MPLYSCPECGDLGCGAVTVNLTVESDRVVWSDWGWQTNYEPGVDRTRLHGIPTMAFERTEYERVLANAR